MAIEFKKVSDFHRGIMAELLQDSYSFDRNYELIYQSKWQENDDFFFDNLHIADKYCFITTLHGEAIGFVAWDPRNMPDYAEIGDNCIVPQHKGKGYGKLQLREAIHRIIQNDVKKIIVTTNDDLIPAQRMYESVGFTLYQRRKHKNVEHMDYVYWLDKSSL